MKKIKVLLTSVSVILLCLSAIVGVSYALFTDSVSVKNHLRAGNLDISLTRTNLVYSVLDEKGCLEEITVTDDLDLTGEVDENVFGIDSADIRIVPGSFFDAELMIQNEGNVAFSYAVGIRLVDGKRTALSDQLCVTVTPPDGEPISVMLSELADGLTIATGQMAKDAESQTFSVKVEFVLDNEYNDENDLSVDAEGYMNNNAAQDKVAVFDLIVTAVQATAQPQG